MDFTYPLRL